MATTLTYQPDKGIALGDILLLWGTGRQQVRTLLNARFEVNDNSIELSQNSEVDAPCNIIQRRDIYTNYRELDNLFFLNFDTNDLLTEVELHHGIDINIEGVVIDFSMGIEKVVDLLDSISAGEKKELSEGEYFFKKLKLTIASSDAMGGEGNELSYFYCSNDITHLIDDEVST